MGGFLLSLKMLLNKIFDKLDIYAYMYDIVSDFPHHRGKVPNTILSYAFITKDLDSTIVL